jgi:REP element-mobilizing transposase RayT
MSTDSQSPRRRGSLRLPQYDYSEPNAYFFTICAFKKQNILGKIVEERLFLSKAGETVWDVWESLGTRFPTVELDAFIVMPNHVHGIVKITSDEVGAIHELPLQTNGCDDPEEERIRRRKMMLPKLIGYLKMNSSKRINQLRGTAGSRVWQRNYYEHIIRTEKALNRLRKYIIENPIKWSDDPERLGR